MLDVSEQVETAARLATGALHGVSESLTHDGWSESDSYLDGEEETDLARGHDG
jgi:hypothetical protein